jgi:Replication-relaxation
MRGQVLRFLLWRLLAIVASCVGLALFAWLVAGGPGKVLRGLPVPDALDLSVFILPRALEGALHAIWIWSPGVEIPVVGRRPASSMLVPVGALPALLVAVRLRARRRRHYVRMRVAAYRTDQASAEALVTMYEALHKRLLRRWWRRLLQGQPTIALEVHHARAGRRAVPGRGGQCSAPLDLSPSQGSESAVINDGLQSRSPYHVWLAVSCPAGLEGAVQAALRSAYPNCRLSVSDQCVGAPPAVLRMKKRASFITRAKLLDRFEQQREPPMNRLMTIMGTCGVPAFVQLAMTPTPVFFERRARRLYKRREARLSRERREHLVMRDRSLVEDAELRGGLEIQHRPLFFVDLRVVAPDRLSCERIAAELRAGGAESGLVERGTAIRHGWLGLYSRRVRRGEGNPLPSFHRGVFASTELAALWQLPSIDFATVPFARMGLPVAPAAPGILRPPEGRGTLRDSLGPVSIHPELRKQNTAVPGAVEQGKSSYLVATVAEDLSRERCAVIVFDPKGDAAEAAVSLVPAQRTCTLLDFSHPTCGFNPLAVDAPADVIADYVVAALKHLFTDADIRASSDRYLRNAIIAVLAYDRQSTLWDAARLLSVGEDGYAYRNRVGARVRTMPEFKEISEFFTAELAAQLADARGMTTAKLDAPVNKLARLLNSPSIKRVLLNDSLRVDFDRVISRQEVLVVRGALGSMGAGNTSVLMQLLIGMLDAALARQQDLVPAERRVAVALKVDEAPLVLNRGFAETMALKRSAGLETVACWQTEAQWTEREVREQLDALFAHRVYFATASARDARAAVELTMAEFSDTVRPGMEHLSALGHPDARLHLPKHHAIVSWATHEGRQPPFVAQTIPLRVDRERLALHAARQIERGGRHRADLRQPHWDHGIRQPTDEASTGERSDDGGERRGHAKLRSSAPAQMEEDRLMPALSELAADSYRELIELDGAHSVRWAKRVASSAALEPELLDLEMLTLVASMRHVLSSQLHRRFNAARAATTTQRRLKRLSDAGLVERFQFHRRDGGGVPMCYVITVEGLALLHACDRSRGLGDDDVLALRSPGTASVSSAVRGERRLLQARRDVHAVGWALALGRALENVGIELRGPVESVLSPPLRSGASGRVALGPKDLLLPGGRAAHEFLRTDATGERVEAERFETVRPNLTVEVPAAAEAASRGPKSTRAGATLGTFTESVDVLVECDDRIPAGGAVGKLERYDHLIAGWSVHIGRYGRRADALPMVVFVCRDRARARECAKRADSVLVACRAYAGEYPFDWEYPGRQQILFASERDVHEGLLCAYGVPRLPPEVRMAAAHGDPRTARAVAEPRALL